MDLEAICGHEQVISAAELVRVAVCSPSQYVKSIIEDSEILSELHLPEHGLCCAQGEL